MFQTDTKISEVMIRDTHDAWEVLFNYEIPDIFGDVLEFFMQQRTNAEFKDLCRALDKSQIRDAFWYFMENYDDAKLIYFFEALEIDQQEYFLEYLIHNVVKSSEFADESSVISARKSFFSRKASIPKNLQSALHKADTNDFMDIIRFLYKNPDKIKQFIGELGKVYPEKDKEIVGGIVLELYNYLPYKAEEPLTFDL